nr:reverse transcriptase domain-containing protein [Tanacetum cinerariifolium]
MVLEHDSLSPGRKYQENVSHGDKTGTTSNKLDLLFSSMFDELLNGPSKVVSKSSAVSTADAQNKCQQLTTPLNNHTTPAPTCQTPSIAPTVISSENINQAKPHAENDQVTDDEFINIFSTPIQNQGETSSRHKGIEVDKAKIEVISKLPHPTNVKGIRSFLGHAGFYRRFIKDFFKISRPRIHLLKKNAPFVFSDDCVQAFRTLKEKLTEAPILITPNWDQPFELMCDASDFTVKAVLGQRIEKHFRPIHYAKDYEPKVQSQRRVNPKIHDVIKKEVEKLLDVGLIYPISDSPWVSPVYCVPKKGGMTVITNDENELVSKRLVTGWRVCIDYQKLNEATQKDHFPLPFMDQMLERLAGNEYYCFLDGFSGYFQIPIDLKDQEKTTFTCPYRTFTYKRMPFGLCNAPGTFQLCMMVIFHDMIEQTVEVFMDDFSSF